MKYTKNLQIILQEYIFLDKCHKKNTFPSNMALKKLGQLDLGQEN
jgi:hypothetical protein